MRDLDWLAENELLERGSAEHAALEEIAGPGYNEVIGWAVDATYEAGARKMVAPEVLSSVLYSVRWALMYVSNDSQTRGNRVDHEGVRESGGFVAGLHIDERKSILPFRGPAGKGGHA